MQTDSNSDANREGGLAVVGRWAALPFVIVGGIAAIITPIQFTFCRRRRWPDCCDDALQCHALVAIASISYCLDRYNIGVGRPPDLRFHDPLATPRAGKQGHHSHFRDRYFRPHHRV